VAHTRVKRFRHQQYWGRPVPGFGDPGAGILIVGLAPAAHGANRTGRVFTGDRSGDFLFAALHRSGLANQAVSESADDGLKLTGAYVTAVARCAPPANKPTAAEILSCRAFLRREWALLERVRAVLCLGRVAMEATVGLLKELERVSSGAPLRFGHGVSHELDDGLRLFASYHPSQQNTFTGRLTAESFDAVLRRVRRHAETTRTRERPKP
jgi:uracil-DNA glycosylase family 4